MKKLIASIMAVATVASMASLSVFADATKVEDSELSITVDKLISDSDDFKVGTETKDDDTKTTKDTIQPDKTIFAVIAESSSKAGQYFTDKDVFKVKYDKGDDNPKMIKSLKVIDKEIGKDGSKVRKTALEIKLKDDMTDTDYKVSPSATFTAKKYILLKDEAIKDGVLDATKIAGYVDSEDKAIASDAVAYIVPNTKITLDFVSFYVKNTVEEGDKDWDAGEGGFVAKPIKNDDNEITWEDANNTLAKLTFEGDSDVNKYYPKLSTKWDESDYAENFADTDAYIRNFVGNPTISATARPVLELNNPFVNDDDELTVAHEDTVIYQVVDGALVDVTDKFTMGENEDGDEVFTIKTRTLGTYIISNGAAVASEEEVPEEVEAPEEEQKANPGTGRF